VPAKPSTDRVRRKYEFIKAHRQQLPIEVLSTLASVKSFIATWQGIILGLTAIGAALTALWARLRRLGETKPDSRTSGG
jgi:hypothetical protein